MTGDLLLAGDYCLLPVYFRGSFHWSKVDRDVWEWARLRSWCLRGLSSPYAVAKIAGRVQQLHALILPLPTGLDVDHINGDPLDNRRSNLRPATRAQNRANSIASTRSASRFKGLNKRPNGKWQAEIMRNGRRRHLGTFATEIEAARAYQAAAIEAFGEFAKPNENLDEIAAFV